VQVIILETVFIATKHLYFFQSLGFINLQNIYDALVRLINVKH